MPETRFVRRRKGIPEQASPVSTQEQARLLNDPAVPINNVGTSTQETNDRYKGAVGVSGQRSREGLQERVGAGKWKIEHSSIGEQHGHGCRL